MSLIPILAAVIFSPFDRAWYYAGRYWPVLLLIAAVIVITAILIRRWRKK